MKYYDEWAFIAGDADSDRPEGGRAAGRLRNLPATPGQDRARPT